MRTLVIAAVLALHGVIHLIGFVVPWGIATVEGFPARTVALGGALVLGDAGARAVGVLWLVAVVAFISAAIGVVRRRSWAPALCLGAAVGSSVLCVLSLPEAGAGLVVDAVIVVAAAWAILRGGDRVPAGGVAAGVPGAAR